MRKRSWLCELATTLVISGLLYSVCIDPVVAQNVTCPTRPLGDNSNACASTAFVQQNALTSTLTHTHILVGNGSNVATDFGPLATFADTGGLTIAPTTGNNPALTINQTASFAGGTSSAIMNHITIADTATFTPTSPNPALNGLTVDINTGVGATISGARQAFTSNVRMNSTIDSATAGYFFVGAAVGSFAQVSPCTPSAGVCDIGATPAASHTRGSFTALNPVASVSAGVTNINGITGMEIDMVSGAGATMQNRVGIDLVINNPGVTGGTFFDYGIYFNMETGGLGWNCAICLDKGNGLIAGLDAPVRSTGTILGTHDAWTVGSVIDVSSLNTATSFFLKGPGSSFTVDGVGKVITGLGGAPGGGSGNAAISLGAVGANPALWVQGSTIRVRLSNDSADAGITASVINASTGFQVSGAATTAHYLRGNGTNYVDAAASTVATDLNGLSASNLQKQTFTSNGTFTFPAGTTSATTFKFTIVGCGGGGGGAATAAPSAGGGGGGSGVAYKWLSGVTASNTVTVTVCSTGGTAGANTGTSGGNGGNSSISSGTQTITTVTANGGTGGTGTATSANNAGGAGGTATNGDINVTGMAGLQGAGTNVNAFWAGVGGASPGLGAGGSASAQQGAAGGVGLGFGGGGGGGVTNAGNQAGGAGAVGVVIVEWVI